MDTVSEIKLIRTDTTLDLSQKAEKVCAPMCASGLNIFRAISQLPRLVFREQVNSEGLQTDCNPWLRS